jgi:uncharacterized protein with FMN-binding domain
MKRTLAYILSAVVVGGFVIYLWLSGQSSGQGAVALDNTGTGTDNNQTPSSTTTGGTGTGTGGTTATSTGTGNTTGGTGTATGGGTVAAGQYKDGSYLGPVADAIYGNLQLKVTVKGGKVTDVAWPIFPDSAGHTTLVSQTSLPQLRQEAIAAQSSKIDIVSGATQTSEAFQQSLAAALAQAKS